MASPSELNLRIQELEREVKELKKALSEYTDIEGYYLEKYQEIFDDIKKSRDEEIKQELENMSLEISVLKQEKDNLSDALEENVIIERKLKDINIRLTELYKLTETVDLDAESEINDLEQSGLQVLEQHKENINRYARKIDKLMNPPFISENILFLKDALINYLRGEGWMNIKIKKDNHRQAQKIKKTLDKQHQEYQEAISQLLIDRESLIAKHREIENIDINHIQDEITRFTIHHEKYLGEMMASLDQIRENHVAEIIDRVKKGSILGYSKREIGEMLDDLLVVFSQELLTTDSAENKEYQKAKRLKKLQSEAEKLKGLDIEKETLIFEIEELREKFLSIQKQVQKIEDFNARVHDTIDNNNQYHNFAENYISFMNFELEIKTMIAEKEKALENFKSLDESKYDDPELLLQQKQIESEIAGLERSLEEARLHIFELRQNPENEKVLKMLLSVINYEEKLPAIYETLNKLKKQIDEKHVKLSYLKDQLVEYQSVLMQIEGLTNED